MDIDESYDSLTSDIINSEVEALLTENTNDPAIASPTANFHNEEEGMNAESTASPEGTASPVGTDDNFPCEWEDRGKVCDKVFLKLYLLNKHSKTHRPPHVCQYCGHRFAVTRDKNRHIGDRHRSEAGLPPSTLFCPVESCKRHHDAFGRKDNLLRHVKKQHKGNPGALAAAKAMDEPVALPDSPDGEEDVNEQ